MFGIYFIFLTAILLRALWNDFFSFSNLLFPIFIWTFIYLFYLEFFVSIRVSIQVSFFFFLFICIPFYLIAVWFWISSIFFSQFPSWKRDHDKYIYFLNCRIVIHCLVVWSHELVTNLLNSSNPSISLAKQWRSIQHIGLQSWKFEWICFGLWTKICCET